MEFSIKSTAPGRQKTECAVIGVFESRTLAPMARELPAAARSYVEKIVKSDMEGTPGTTLTLHGVTGTECKRLMLVGLGPEKKFGDRQYRAAVASAVRALIQLGVPEAEIHLTRLEMGERDAGWRTAQAVLVAREAVYSFQTLKSSKKSPTRLARVTIMVDVAEARSAQKRCVQAVAVADGVDLARDLGNLPGNVCTPSYLADQARTLAKSFKLGIKVLERKDMEKLGMGSLLSVAQGSVQPPKLIVLEYQGGNGKQPPVVLVGKGITFDTGGISLKPAPEMDEMKYDMSGAGSVLGTMKAIATMKLPLNVVGIIPTTENMPGGRATKPGDIVKTMSGQTVEILNTDAEGRLILCDALTYAERYKPAAVIDIATLTGACVIALGHVASGMFSNDDSLAEEIRVAGGSAYDRVWHLPLWDDYQEQLKSNFADFANIGGRPAGSVTAACFLARFAGKFKWAHLDIAGTAWRSGKDKGSTGRPVPLLTEFLIRRASR